MSGFLYRDGKLERAPECPPGAHDALWRDTPSGGRVMRCDACLTIQTWTSEALRNVARLMEPPPANYDFPVEGTPDPDVIVNEDGTHGRRNR